MLGFTESYLVYFRPAFQGRPLRWIRIMHLGHVWQCRRRGAGAERDVGRVLNSRHCTLSYRHVAFGPFLAKQEISFTERSETTSVIVIYNKPRIWVWSCVYLYKCTRILIDLCFGHQTGNLNRTEYRIYFWLILNGWQSNNTIGTCDKRTRFVD